MRNTDSRADVMTDILRLHAQAVAAVDYCQQVQNSIRLFEKFLELKRDYRVKWAPPFLVIDGGLSQKKAGVVTD